MDSLIELLNNVALIQRFNSVALEQTCPLETIWWTKNTADGDGWEARVVLSLKFNHNTLGQVYLPPQFTDIFTPSDIWVINNDRVRFVLTIVKIDDDHPKNLQLEFEDEDRL